MMHRFFVTLDAIHGDAVNFQRAQAHQIRDVLRMRAGQEVVVLDNAGAEFSVVLTECTRENVRGEIAERREARGEPAVEMILYQALLKSDKMEWVLQKGTEVGVGAFVPVKTARSIADTVSKQKHARWTQIVTEGAEQAGRGKIPTVDALQSFDGALAAARTRGGATFVLWENEDARDLSSALDGTEAKTLHLFVGPEGGLTEQEIETAQKAGAQSITLGPRILRAETAGLVAASAILFARGELSRK